MAADADLTNDVGVALEPHRVAGDRRRGARAGQVDEHPRGIGNALLVERYLGVELYRDPDGIGQRGAANVPDGHER